MRQSISIVLATHNGEAFLAPQLDSLARQIRPPDEIIISDDRSNDSTVSILKAFQSACPFPVTLLQNNPALGFRENFLQAARHATSDWIAFCDQDDVWRPDKLAVCAAHFETPGVTQIAHAAQLIDADGQITGRFDQGIKSTRVRKPLSYDVWGTFFGFSLIFRRDLLSVVPPEARFLDYIDPGHRIAHDRWIFFLGQILGCTAEIAAPLVQYRQHDANAFGAQTILQPRTRDAIQRSNASYVEATRDMVAIIEALPEALTQRFPAFDKASALHVFRSALHQAEMRDRIYAAPRLAGLLMVARHGLTGGYRRAESGAQRWRSIAKDLLYCLS